MVLLQAKEIIELLRNVALIAIPFVLWFASKKAEIHRATLNIIRELDKDIVPHLERLFIFRKYEDGIANNLSQTPINPYEHKPALFLFDSVMVLKIYDAICAEIEMGALDEKLLYSGIRNSVVGAEEVMLDRFNKRVGSDQSHLYKYLGLVSARWKKRAASYNEMGATKIPGD